MSKSSTRPAWLDQRVRAVAKVFASFVKKKRFLASPESGSTRAAIIAILLIVLTSQTADAHESRPGYLELRQTSQTDYDATWKQPANGDYALRMGPQFPPTCTVHGAQNQELLPGALLSRFTVSCLGGLNGKTITIAGLEMTLTDVLVRVNKLDGSDETHLARATATSVVIGGGDSGTVRAGIYLGLGIQHILMGVDHLLFVLGLLLIVRDGWALIKTVSSFTLAHSITLAAATLGYASIPAPPLNLAIALSILFLGPEIMRVRAGGTSLTIRRPWLIAFAFGLLHGFGFATGLVAMGLPHAEIPLALLLFNCGVEIGQLAFVLLILALERSFRLMLIHWPRPVALLPAYTVGVLGAFWTLQRLTIYLGATA